jgi:hypothetical protein
VISVEGLLRPWSPAMMSNSWRDRGRFVVAGKGRQPRMLVVVHSCFHGRSRNVVAVLRGDFVDGLCQAESRT